MPSSASFASYASAPERYDEVFGPEGRPREHWESLVQATLRTDQAELARRARTIRRAVEQDGVTYNIYANAKGADRPWEVDLLPLIIGPEEWSFLAGAVKQRAQLLNAVLADLYGPNRLLARGLLPPAIVYGHNNYLWPCRGLEPPGGVHLHLYGCDVARSANGRWWVIADRTQGPSGAGYALQNRLIVAPLYAGLFRSLNAQRLARFFRTLQQTLAALAPTDGEPPLIAILTPGPYNETYFEHVFLARYLGFALIEGSDLTVRDNRVYLKTLQGLRRAHVLLRRIDDEYCDPAALRADSALGIPGLLQAARAGNVVIANALGSGVLETPALPGFLPAICEQLLGEPLAMHSVATWWCGEQAALDYVLAHLPELVIKPAFPSMKLEPTFGHLLDAAGREEMAERLRGSPNAYVAQEWVRLSQAPTWSAEREQFDPRVVGLRLYAVATANGYEVMPGGLARVSPESDTDVISMQRGGSSKDTWVLARGATPWDSLLQPRVTARDVVRGSTFSASRTVENLFWMGRYSERIESAGRLLRATAYRLVESAPSRSTELEVLTALCDAADLRKRANEKNGDSSAASPEETGEEWLIAAVGDARVMNGIRANAARLLHCASQVRERMSLDNWHVVQRLAHPHDPVPEDLETALTILDRVVPACTALSGYALDDMVRDDAWRFLVIGRMLERARFLSALIAQVLLLPEAERNAVLTGLLEIGNSIITYRARYQRQAELLPVIDLLVLDESNPHAIAFQLERIGRQLDELRARLAFRPANDPRPLLEALHGLDLARFDSAPLPFGEQAPLPEALVGLLQACERCTYALSDELSQRFFVHVGDETQTSFAA